MKRKKLHINLFCLLLLLFPSIITWSQIKVKGTVYDDSKTYPIEAVSVMGTNGGFAISDTLGHFQIQVSDKDSIWFSYQGKPSPKFPVNKIADISRFDISLKLKMDVLQEVRVHARNYRQDSMQNRRDYAKIFNYQKVSVGSMTSIGPTGAGIDLDELIRVFQFKKNKAMLKFQQRLLEEEREKYIDHRFNKPLVRSLTALDGDDLIRFMQKYRPSYEFTAFANDYDFRLYIKRAFEEYKENPTRTF